MTLLGLHLMLQSNIYVSCSLRLPNTSMLLQSLIKFSAICHGWSFIRAITNSIFAVDFLTPDHFDLPKISNLCSSMNERYTYMKTRRAASHSVKYWYWFFHYILEILFYSVFSYFLFQLLYSMEFALITSIIGRRTIGNFLRRRPTRLNIWNKCKKYSIWAYNWLLFPCYLSG
jgi:hypothetical protein